MRGKFRKWIHDAIDARLIRRSRSVVIDGLWIGVSTSFAEEPDHLLDRVSSAVRLIGTCDPIKYKDLLKNIDQVLVGLSPGNAAHHDHRRRRIVLSPRHIADVEDEVIATWIVHEATHARLDRFGYAEGIRARIERCCIRRELAFARKCPDGQYIVDWLSPALATQEEDYSNAAVEARQRHEVMEFAGDSRVLQALFRTAIWLRERRVRRAARVDGSNGVGRRTGACEGLRPSSRRFAPRRGDSDGA